MKVFLTLLGMLLSVLSVSGATIVVTNTNDSGPGSLRNAIQVAAAGDIVDASGISGTISLSSGQIDIISGQNISVIGSGSSNLTIDCSFNSRAFNISNAIVSISDLRITRGAALDMNGGGGILAAYSVHLTLSYVQVDNCEAIQFTGDRGGGIRVIGYDPATWSELGPSSLDISYCQVENCRAYIGGGLNFAGYSEGYDVTVSNSTFKNNSTGAYGTLSSGNDGGGIQLMPKQDGNPNGGTVEISNCTFSGNATGGPWNSRSGGAMSLGTGHFNINSCTISGNSAPTQGGGISFWGGWSGGTCTLTNNIIANNTAITSGNNVDGVIASGGHNIIGDDGTANGFTNGTDQNNTNPMLGGLGNNGGFGETFAIDCSSPAVDAGGGNPLLDQLDQPRICDPDIGSFEFQTNCTCTPLPVELLNFKATPDNHVVYLNWTTITERDNDYFIVERSKDGTIWEHLLTEDGAGNSLVKRDYSEFDYNPFNGVSYYRLTQFDHDGTSTVFPPVSINRNSPSEHASVELSPTVSDGNLNISIRTTDMGEYNYVILDATGRQVHQGSFIVNAENTLHNTELKVLKPGHYYLQIQHESFLATEPKRFVIK